MIRRALKRLRSADADLIEVLRGSAVALGIKILAVGSVFAMNVVIARQLGANEAGLFFLAYTIVFIAASVSRLGLDNTFVRFMAGHHATEEWGAVTRLYTLGIRWSLFASLIITATFWLLAEPLAITVFGKPDFTSVIQIMSLGIPLLALSTLHANALQGIKCIPQSMIVLNVASPAGLVVLAFFLSVSHATTAGWLWVVASTATLVVGILLWHQRAETPRTAIEIDRKEILASCLPLLSVVVLSQTVNWSSQIMLGAWASSSDVAVFNAAQRTAMLISFVLVAVNSIAAPKFAAMHRLDQYDAMRRIAKHTTRLMILSAFVPLTLMLAFPGPILLLFGAEFIAGATSLQILAIGQFINVGTGCVGLLLTMTGHERLLRNNIFTAAAITLAMGFALVPPYGLTGAAIATATGVALQNLLSVWQVQRVLGFNTLAVWR
jgi:O-antigen/teichoic acid export membrane protein